MSSEQKNLFMAIGLSALILFGWQTFLAPKLQNTATNSETTAEQAAVTTKGGVAATKSEITSKTGTTQSSATTSSAEAGAVNKLEEQDYVIEQGSFRYVLSNYLTLKDITTDKAVYTLKNTIGEDAQIQLELLTTNGFSSLPFNVSQPSQNRLEVVNPQFGFKFVAVIGEDGRLNLNVNNGNIFKLRYKINSKEEEASGRKFRELLVNFPDDVERATVGEDENGEGSISWFGMDFNHHLFAISFDQSRLGAFKTLEDGNIYITLKEASNSFSSDTLFTKKNYDDLLGYGNNLHLAVDFGILGLISVPILRGLQFTYKMIPNYGIAIIILTFLMRLVTFPLQYKSFASMKKMQNLTPQIQKIKEKYKDDQPKMQQESMALFKKAGVNPLGGCLPMILQMPIFFAFYKVLYEAVELVGAPFYFWITDLSIKDQYYVLPVLVGAVMLVNQKLTPSPSADPVQQKVMMVMPIVFGFIMKDLPAGLNLYIFVSMLMGIVQQLLVYKKIDAAKA